MTSRITTLMGKDQAHEFTELTRRLGVSGTALVGRTLGRELDELERFLPNSEFVSSFLRRWFTGHKSRLSLTLSRKHAERLTQLCEEKRVPRDFFMSCYIGFLVEVLNEAAEVLENPRDKYEEAKPYAFLNLTDEQAETIQRPVDELLATLQAANK